MFQGARRLAGCVPRRNTHKQQFCAVLQQKAVELERAERDFDKRLRNLVYERETEKIWEAYRQKSKAQANCEFKGGSLTVPKAIEEGQQLFRCRDLEWLSGALSKIEEVLRNQDFRTYDHVQIQTSTFTLKDQLCKADSFGPDGRPTRFVDRNGKFCDEDPDFVLYGVGKLPIKAIEDFADRMVSKIADPAHRALMQETLEDQKRNYCRSKSAYFITNLFLKL